MHAYNKVARPQGHTAGDNGHVQTEKRSFRHGAEGLNLDK